MTQSAIGGPAQTIYQVTDRKGVVGRDAVRVVVVTDSRPAEGGPQQAAYFVSDAEIASGEFIVTGNRPLAIVKVDAQGAEYPPIAVYDVTGQANDAQPTQDVYTLTVTTSGSGSVSATPSKSKYASGDVVTLTATPGGGATFGGWSGDASGTSASITLTINGDKAIAAAFEGGGGPTLPQVASATLLLDLRASQLALSDGDPVGTWPDASGNNNDFTQTGLARPVFVANVDGAPAVRLDQEANTYNGQWMVGPVVQPTIPFAVFTHGKYDSVQGYNQDILAKQTNTESPGFIILFGDQDQYVGWRTTIDISNLHNTYTAGLAATHVECAEILSLTTGHIYVNGSNDGEFTYEVGSITDISNSEPLTFGGTTYDVGRDSGYTGWTMALLIYEITDLINWPTDRAAIEAWLATNP